MDIRQMNKTNLEHWRGLRKQLWPGHPDDAHLASFIAMANGVAIGFADASIRHDYVNGCDSSPVAFLEGIFVLPSVAALINRSLLTQCPVIRAA